MARKVEVTWQEDEETLHKLYKQEQDPQNRTRLQALWLVHRGHTIQAASEVVGVG
jgi:hypothetical protein